MSQRIPVPVAFGGQYYPNSPPAGIARPRPCLIAGRNVYCREEGYCESWNGMSAAGAAMAAGLLVPLGGDALPGGLGAGTVLVWRNDSTWYIGSGSVYRNAVSIGTASSALKFLLGGVTFVAGLAQPAAPVLRLTNETNKKPRGTYSIKITQVRTETGEESNASLPSNSVTASGQRLLVDMSGIATVSDGKRWAVYGSDGGFSQLGPWFFRLEFNSSQLSTIVDSESVGRPLSIAIEYYDLETSSLLAPFEFAPPPAGTHMTTLGSVVVVLGSYGGAGVSPSLPGRLGWPASFTRFLNPAEPIQRVDGRPENGWQTVYTSHSVQAVILSGDETGPVFVRSRWPVGILNPNGAVSIDSNIYAILGDGYLARSEGGVDLDTKFSYPVRSEVKALNPATTMVGYHQKEDAVLYFDNANAAARPFDRGRGGWHTTFDMPGPVEALADVNGKLYVLIGGALYTFDGGSGAGLTCFAVPDWEDLGDSRGRKTIFSFAGSFRGAGTTDLLGARTSYDTSTSLESQVDSASGDHLTDQVKTNIKKLKAFTFKRSVAGGGGRAYEVVADVVRDDSRVDVS